MMKKLEDAMRRLAEAMVAFWAVFSAWCVSRITDARTWCQERRRERDERPRRTRINVAVHNNRILPTFVIIIVLNCSYLAMERMLKKVKKLKKEETSCII